MMQLIQIASSAPATIPIENPWTAVALAVLISLGLLAAALMALAINRGLTRGWIRFSQKQQIRHEEEFWGVEEQSGSAEF